MQTISMPSLASQLRYEIPKIKLCLVHEGQTPKNLFALRTAEDVQEFLEPLRFAAEESFVTLHLNAKHEVIGMHEVSHGTLASAIVHPREVFKAAVLANSYAIMVCHNHPSYAQVEPSAEDLDVTARLIWAGKMLQISVLDHLILSPNQDCYSIRANFPALWAK
jgi:DNA repair protein RadC